MKLEKNDKFDYPITAVREVILNALVHRDYSIHTEGMPIQITMYNDRLEVKNAGLPAPVFENSRGTFTVTLYKNSDYIKNYMGTEDSILDFCSIPQTRMEIANFLGISTPTYAISKYIKPLIKEGKIEMTNLERPNSPNQKYFTKS